MIKMTGNHTLILLTLFILALAGWTQSQSCTPSYEILAAKTSTGGTGVPGATTVKLCQDACEAADACIGFTFNTDDDTCFTYTNPSLSLTPHPSTDFYAKKWDCGNCVYAVLPNKRFGSVVGTVSSTTTIDECAVACSNDPSCMSLDFDTLFFTSNCVLYTVSNIPSDSPGFFHLKKIFCTTPAPCASPPPECGVVPKPCNLPAGMTCGLGTTDQNWGCMVEGALQVYFRTRLCCIPCPVANPCDTPSNQDCIVGSNPTTAVGCWDQDCCWIPGTPNRCLKAGVPPKIKCQDVWPACETQ